MDIYIEVIRSEIVIVEEVPCARGKITIGDFDERFNIALEDWSIDDYKRQWQEGLERIKTHGKSCLVSYVQDPSKSPFINWWPMYKIDNKIYVQNHILFAHIYRKRIGSKEFTPDTCYDFIPNRRNSKEKVSEWVVDLE
ncbi:hypothetical protein H0X48_05775 [Candidatus Dependentiae bacterium]|nr:hypothetical protein [Tatlockia sp.]MBA3954799.1 hypothetical protein [Candidatus Dependentiae bacterium]